jgi:beta-glucosidase
MAEVRVAAMLGRLLLPLLTLAVVACGADDHGGAGLPPISRRSFPEGFIFGTASSSYQVKECFFSRPGTLLPVYYKKK